MVRRGLSIALACMMVLSVVAPAVSADPNEMREPDVAFQFSQPWGEEATGTEAELDAQWRKYVIDQLNAAKKELEELEKWYKAALAKYEGVSGECEREAIERFYLAEKQRLKSNVQALRGIRGDTRGFFTKAWHRIGPSGRRILNAFGKESLAILKSGGTLQGGIARRILIRLARKELKNVAVKAIARKVLGRAAVAQGAAEAECKDNDFDPRNPDPLSEEGALAVPPARYVGAFREAELVWLLAFDGGKPETNTIELVVAEDEIVTGSFAVYQKGPFIGCPGQVSDWKGTLEESLMGDGFPLEYTVAVEVADFSSYDVLADECILPPVAEFESTSADLVLKSLDGDVITGELLGLLPFTLERVE